MDSSIKSSKYKEPHRKGEDNRNHLVSVSELSTNSSAARWRKREPKYEPRYPRYGLDPINIQGVSITLSRKYLEIKLIS